MTRRQRLAVLLGVLAAAGMACALVLYALRSNLVFFHTPSQVANGEAPASRPFRMGGLVQPDSVRRDGMTVRFIVTDGAHARAVRYEGALPDLFKEGKGVVAMGRLGADGVFAAREVLAKHDENYMPPDAAAALAAARKAAP